VEEKNPVQDADTEYFSIPDVCTPQSLLYLILIGALMSVVFTLVKSDFLHFSWTQFAITSFMVLWVILVSAVLLCWLRPRMIRLPLQQGFIVCFIIVIAVTALSSFMSQLLAVTMLDMLPRISSIMLFNHVLIATILAGIGLRYLYLQEQLHQRQQSELASRIQALQSRIRPHFLFNSMNIIASLIASDPELAEEVVEDLSELFRAALSEASQLTPLNHEIDLTVSYVRIEQLRLGERLEVIWDIDELKDSVTIPHLSLQPLLENAIYHGIQPLPEGGTIKVSVHIRNQRVHVAVSNPFSTAKGSGDHKGNKLALQNLVSRLQAFYPERSDFSIDTTDSTFTVSFSYPLSSSGAGSGADGSSG
jgi:two-component system sensor histidine kinase AlgZ